MKNKKAVLLPFLLLLFSCLFSSEKKINISRLPEISFLSSKDEVFKEYTAIVDENYKNLASGSETMMLFFKCRIQEKTNLLALAARCNIPYETIATLNHIESNGKIIEGNVIILPTVPGLFINTKSNDFLTVILQTRCNAILQKENLCYNFDTESFIFLQNERFSPTERAYFLDTSLGLPVDSSQSIISSSFGRRKNPFSGEWKNHNGVDFAANEGTPVYAVKDGTVYLAKNDPVFGNYIILKHRDNDATSVYAHLSKMNVKAGQKVKRGDIIGNVGKTGMATGPHLHFEIRFGGIAEDPEKYLPVKQKNED